MKESSCVSKTSLLTQRDARLIERAIAVLEDRVFKRGAKLSNPIDIGNYLRLRLGKEPHEVFAVLFLDNGHRLIAFEPLFQGTIDTTTVHPRTVLQRAIVHNCAAVVLVHNHPSGSTTPSAIDRHTTTQLRDALALVNIRVLDHFIVGAGEPFSFARAGFI